jgi:hypothetical protein
MTEKPAEPTTSPTWGPGGWLGPMRDGMGLQGTSGGYAATSVAPGKLDRKSAGRHLEPWERFGRTDLSVVRCPLSVVRGCGGKAWVERGSPFAAVPRQDSFREPSLFPQRSKDPCLRRPDPFFRRNRVMPRRPQSLRMAFPLARLGTQ